VIYQKIQVRFVFGSGSINFDRVVPLEFRIFHAVSALEVLF
jgi:hypothetical protein